ncbi:unnamed protein product [Paramecium primaurelia]|uniref:Uncharacterized protein n=1 Tax=Paramecium primaurelia TaxID=5886 RepID=A0A8S1NLU1_PARPR|nr:unnamed protein product [Paramecium primaurelia]
MRINKYKVNIQIFNYYQMIIVKQSKQKAEDRRNELILVSWALYYQKFIIPEFPKQFKEQVKKSLTKQDRLLNLMIGSDCSIYQSQWIKEWNMDINYIFLGVSKKGKKNVKVSCNILISLKFEV